MMTFVALGYINDRRSRNGIQNKTSTELWRFQMHQSCYSIDFFISIFQACAPRYVYYIFMDRMDPVGVCYSARNACSEKRPQIRHHRPCVESGKAMRSETKISCPRCANVYFFLFPHSQILMSVNSLSLSCSVSTTCQTTPEYRHVPRGIFGSRATSNVVSL